MMLWCKADGNDFNELDKILFFKLKLLKSYKIVADKYKNQKKYWKNN